MKRVPIFFFCLFAVSIAWAQSPKPTLVKEKYPSLASGALTSARLAVLPSGVLLRSGDLTITQEQLDSDIREAPEDIHDHLKNNAFFMLENRSTGDLLTAEAKAWAAKNSREQGEDSNQLIQAYLDDLLAAVSVTDDEMATFYNGNRDMFGTATFDQVKEDLKEYLLSEKRQKAVDAHILSIGERAVVEVNQAWTARQYALAMNNKVDKARKSGRITMVDFSGEGCRPCEMMEPILESVKKQYAAKANIVVISTNKEPALSSRYGIQVIPVQIFFDKTGQEVFRHEGFFPKEQIAAKLAEMGVK